MTRAKKSRRQTGTPGRIRVIGGDLRGSVLAVADQPGLRPTPNRLRETLFNWLQPHMAGARCLDLFAGSGALGIEALSRGAGHVCLVERDARLAQSVGANLVRLRQDGKSRVHAVDALTMLAAAPSETFDIAFVDPPFASGLWDRSAELLESGGWLAPQAWIYLEIPVETRVEVPSAWTVQRETAVGDVCGVLYRRRPDPLS